MSFALEPSTAWSTLLAFIKVTCVLVAALAATRLMRRSAAVSRHLVWLVALIAALALPLWSAWSPLPVRVLPAAAPAAPATNLVPTAKDPGIAEPVPTMGRAVTTAIPVSRRPIGLGAALLALWSLGAVALFGRLLIGAWIARDVVRRGHTLEEPDWQRTLYEVADRLNLDQAPRLVQSGSIKMPFATGLLNAVIVLPAESTSWSEERRVALLIHELAHIKRRDLIGHLVSRVACAVYWFHPLVWKAARQLRAESERACDDLALLLGTPASEYAEHLLEVATEARDDRMPAVALAMAKPNELEGRMLAILDPRRQRRGPGRARSAVLVGALTALALVLGALSPARRAAATPPEPGSGPATPLMAGKDEGGSTSANPAERGQRMTHTETHSETHTGTSTRSARDRDQSDDSAENADNTQRVQVLARSLRSDTDAEVRRVAAWGLERYADDDVAARALAEAAVGEKDDDVREMATWALAGSRDPAAVTAILTAMRDRNAKVRETAVWAAGSIGSPSAVDALTPVLADKDPAMREVAAWSIGSCSPERAPAALIRLLGDADRDVRLSTAWALHSIGDASAAEPLEAAFRREKDPEVQRGLIRALGSMGEKAVATLTRLVDSPDREIRAVAVTALAGGNASGPWPWPRPEPRPYP